MTQKKALLIILYIAALGIAFSGFLSYRELFLGNCNLNFISCGASVARIPACVYGLIMYTVVFIVALLGYKSKK